MNVSVKNSPRFLYASERGRLVVTPTTGFSPKEFAADDEALIFLEGCIETLNRKLALNGAMNEQERDLLEVLLSSAPSPNQNSPGKCGGGCSCPTGTERKSVELFLILAQFCNLGCTYCLDGQETYQTHRHLRMSEETARMAVDRMLETLRAGDNLTITFFGGEPLLNWRTVKSTIEHAKERCLEKLVQVQFAIQTNLTFLPQDFVETALAANLQIVCSIDGPEDVHNALRPHRDRSANSYRLTAARLAVLRESGVHFTLRATVTSMNAGRLLEVANHHSEMGAAGTIFGLFRPVNSDGHIFNDALAPDMVELARSFEELYHHRPDIVQEIVDSLLSRMQIDATVRACGAAYMATPTIDANGDLYSCAWFVGQADKLIGSIWGEQFMRPVAVQKNFDRFDNRLDPVCGVCDYYSVCRGGCAATRLALGEDSVSHQANSVLRDQQCALVKTVMRQILLEHR